MSWGVIKKKKNVSILTSYLIVKFLEILVPDGNLHPAFFIPVVIYWESLLVDVFKYSRIFIFMYE